jgi:hypothetical protein
MEGRADYDEQIDKVIRHCRWLQIKRVIKLCDNTKAGKRGDDGYDPAYKYDIVEMRQHGATKGMPRQGLAFQVGYLECPE